MDGGTVEGRQTGLCLQSAALTGVTENDFLQEFTVLSKVGWIARVEGLPEFFNTASGARQCQKARPHLTRGGQITTETQHACRDALAHLSANSDHLLTRSNPNLGELFHHMAA